MALIKCSKCGKEISDKSSKCVHCGNTTKKFENAVKLKNSESFNKKINCKWFINKKIVLCGVSLVVFVVAIVIVILFNKTDKIEKVNVEEILSRYTWISNDKNKVQINFNFKDVNSSDYYSSGNCMLYSDYIDKTPQVEEENCFVSLDKEKNSLKISTSVSGRHLKDSKFEYDLTFDPKLKELKLIDDNKEEIVLKGDKKIDLKITTEPYFKDYSLLKADNRTAYLNLYRNNYCEISFKEFAKTVPTGGLYLFVNYTDGDCTYEKISDLDFVINYKGTFSTTVNTPGLNTPQYNYVFQTENQEMKIKFEDDTYKKFTITNGKYDYVNSAVYFKSN